MAKDLSSSDEEFVKEQAEKKLGECSKTYDIIGTQIFSILSLYARVIYYPLGKAAPWGFTRIFGSQNGTYEEKPFVAINTSIPIDCQVFAAAHELYHIWFEQKPDMIPTDLLNERRKAITEKKANRFAAEFLVSEIMLRQEIKIYKIKKITIKTILQLATLFMVPYQAMVKRLNEIGIISLKERGNFLDESEDSITGYRKKYAMSLAEPDEKIALDNLAELAADAFESKYITFEKLEYLLSLCGLSPAELNITRKSPQTVPSDEELDSIMEESV